MEINEIEILKKVIKGNPNAYSYILKKYESKVFTLAYRILRNREDAEEASQDSFLKCYYALPEFNFNSSFSTWLYRIAYTTSISLLRKRKPLTQPLDYDFIDENIDISSVNDAITKFKNEEQKKYLDDAISKLDEVDSSIIYLYYQEEKNVEEIATIIDMTKSNIKIRLYRARKKLFDEINKVLRKEVYDLI
jgi:RNA polymerase sigma factor (sigma-70 family)